MMYDEEYYKQMEEANSCKHEHLDDLDADYWVCRDCDKRIPKPQVE